MNILLFLCLSFVTGICLSIYTYAIECSTFNYIESSLCLLDHVNLYFLRTIHFSVLSFFTLYLFFVDISVKYDTIIAISIILIFLQWSILGGCILTILEKRILFPDGINYPEKMPFLSLLNVPDWLTVVPDEVIFIIVVILFYRIFIASSYETDTLRLV